MEFGNALESQKIDYPWLVFKLQDRQFAVNSEYAASILLLPENVTSLPDAPEYFRGIIELRGSIISLLDMRQIFGMATMKQEFEEFKCMLDARKQDHLRWVELLEETAETGEEFTLARDPHQCAFGKWYDNFTTNDYSIMNHMKKIEEPHRRLHEAADEVLHCERKCDACKREKCLRRVFKELKDEIVPRIVNLMDEAKDIFKQNYREMVIVLENGQRRVGIIVDEMVAVDVLQPVDTTGGLDEYQHSRFIEGIGKMADSDELILMLNNQLLEE